MCGADTLVRRFEVALPTVVRVVTGQEDLRSGGQECPRYTFTAPVIYNRGLWFIVRTTARPTRCAR